MAYGRDYRLRDASADAPKPLSTHGRWRESPDDRRNPAMILALVCGIGLPLAFVVYVVFALIFG